jgi:CRISPR/Cas system CMR-associated protein Cmr3 (group 5 of RAMP superfamily)
MDVNFSSEVKTITFDNQSFLIFMSNENFKAYVCVKNVCDNMGISSKWQVRKIKEDTVLREKIKSVACTYANEHREWTFLEVDFFLGWLCSIRLGEKSKSAKPMLFQYKDKYYRLLDDYFSKLWRNIIKNLRLLRYVESDLKRVKRKIRRFEEKDELLAERKRFENEVEAMQIDTQRLFDLK